MNITAVEKFSLGQKAVFDVYTKENNRRADIVDYGLLDTMHELKDHRYGKANKARNLEPSMAEMLTGGYTECQQPVKPEYLCNLDDQNLTEEQVREIAEKLLRKEQAKGKWMTEARDNTLRKFTDNPAENVYYIGNQMLNPHKFGSSKDHHYKTSYKRDFGEPIPDEDGHYDHDLNQPQLEPELEAQQVSPNKPKGSKSANNRAKSKDQSPDDKIATRQKTPLKRK